MPFKNNLHVDKLLSQISVRYKNTNYIADQVFPTLPVKEDSNLYRVFVRNFRIPETQRAPGGLAKEFDFDVSTASYQLQRHALKAYVTDDDARNYDLANLRADTTEHLTDAILRREESRVANLFTTTSWSLNVSLAATDAKFNQDTVLSNPIPVFDTGMVTVIQNSGLKPNFGIIHHTDMLNIKNHVSILDRLKFTTAEVTEKKIAALLGIETLLTPMSIEDTSAEGLAEVIADIWDDNAFLGWKPARPSPLAPSSGYMFKQSRPLVKRFRVEEREAEAIEVNVNSQPKVVASLTGYLIKDVRA